jgi:hypothetical protein
VAAAAAGLVLLGFLAEAAFQSLRLSWQLHQAEQRAEDRRLRLAARGLADHAESAEAAPRDAAVDPEDLVRTVEQAEVPSPGPAPRREPRAVRESLVIPVRVVAPEQDRAAPKEEDTSQEAAVEDDDVQSRASEPSGPGSDPDSSGTVDLAADQPVETGRVETDSAEAQRLTEGADQGDAPGRVVDGDSTVDLTVDPAVLAEIRAAQRGGSTGDDTPVGTA